MGGGTPLRCYACSDFMATWTRLSNVYLEIAGSLGHDVCALSLRLRKLVSSHQPVRERFAAQWNRLAMAHEERLQRFTSSIDLERVSRERRHMWRADLQSKRASKWCTQQARIM